MESPLALTQYALGTANLLRKLAVCIDVTSDLSNRSKTSPPLSIADLKTVIRSAPTLYSCLEDLLSSPPNSACPSAAVRKATALFNLSQSTSPSSSATSAISDVSRLSVLLKAKRAFLTNLRNACIDPKCVRALTTFIDTLFDSPLISANLLPSGITSPNTMAFHLPKPVSLVHRLDITFDQNATSSLQNALITSFPLTTAHRTAYVHFLTAVHRLRSLQESTIISLYAVHWPFPMSEEAIHSPSQSPTFSPSSTPIARAFVVTEHMPTTLNDIFGTPSLHPRPVRMRILYDVLSALVAVHATGIRHGALSARSVRLQLHDNVVYGRAKLDLPPLIHAVLSTEHVADSTLDVLMFRPPEFFTNPSPEFLTADVWSFGILACLLFAEQSPGRRITDEESLLFMRDGPQRFAERLQCNVADSQLSNITARCLCEDPAGRFTGTELQNALFPLLRARGAIPCAGWDQNSVNGPGTASDSAKTKGAWEVSSKPNGAYGGTQQPFEVMLGEKSSPQQVKSIVNGVIRPSASTAALASPRVPNGLASSGHEGAPVSSDFCPPVPNVSATLDVDGSNAVAHGGADFIESDDTFEQQLQGVAKKGVKRAATQLLSVRKRMKKGSHLSIGEEGEKPSVKQESDFVASTANTDMVKLEQAKLRQEKPAPNVRVKLEPTVGGADALASTGLQASTPDPPLPKNDNVEKTKGVWSGRMRVRARSRLSGPSDSAAEEESRLGGSSASKQHSGSIPSPVASPSVVNMGKNLPGAKDDAIIIPKRSFVNSSGVIVLNSAPPILSSQESVQVDVDPKNENLGDGVTSSQKRANKKRRRSSKGKPPIGGPNGDKKDEGIAGVVSNGGSPVIDGANKLQPGSSVVPAALSSYDMGMMFAEGRGVVRDDVQALYHLRSAMEEGCTKAKVELARRIEKGLGTTANAVLASQFYVSAAEMGESEAFFDAARCYDSGMGVEVNKERAFELYKKGTAVGNVGCMMKAAKMCDVGDGVKKSVTDAYRYYSMAANGGSVEAKVEVAGCLAKAKGVRRNLSRAVELYREASNAGNPAAMLALGLLYEDGNGVRKNSEYALRLYQKSAAMGHGPGITAMGQCYLWGYGVVHCYKTAREHFTKAAELGHGLAFHELGMLYREGSGVERNYEQAVACFRKAVERDCEVAMVQLGDCLYNGYGTEVDMDEAFRMFDRSAKLGAMEGFRWLGDCYMDGTGVAKNQKKAVELYRKASDLGSAAALTSLASCYEHGHGVGLHVSKAVSMYRRAADSGDPTAENNLGILYENGKHVKKDTERAVRHYRKATQHGSVEAMCNLADCYATGTGVEKDEREAFRWFEQAAKGGHGGAQCDLGLCYLNGKGVGKDVQYAIKLLEQASEREAEAARQLGRIYMDGNGVVRDCEKGFMFMLDAAERGNREALCDVGSSYQYGRGVDIDQQKAYQFLLKSAEQGYSIAQASLGSLLFNMERYDEAIKWLTMANGTATEIARTVETGVGDTMDTAVGKEKRAYPSGTADPADKQTGADLASPKNGLGVAKSEAGPSAPIKPPET